MSPSKPTSFSSTVSSGTAAPRRLPGHRVFKKTRLDLLPVELELKIWAYVAVVQPRLLVACAASDPGWIVTTFHHMAQQRVVPRELAAEMYGMLERQLTANNKLRSTMADPFRPSSRAFGSFPGIPGPAILFNPDVDVVLFGRALLYTPTRWGYQNWPHLEQRREYALIKHVAVHVEPAGRVELAADPADPDRCMVSGVAGLLELMVQLPALETIGLVVPTTDDGATADSNARHRVTAAALLGKEDSGLSSEVPIVSEVPADFAGEVWAGDGHLPYGQHHRTITYTDVAAQSGALLAAAMAAQPVPWQSPGLPVRAAPAVRPLFVKLRPDKPVIDIAEVSMLHLSWPERQAVEARAREQAARGAAAAKEAET
ncbi:hypothetical protein B0T26DRAFT_746388 [Lasiosphaeria miniovina]|uniref:Uncharacterized protein n=1 Tax=Lasiosphaeria miniovina TaxID=1954250 RepID=A0AA40BHX1_9PEZI|nr:uncharacterized protein B0T26DRAFT_746388 [Lasiosphaeria miniovina]KAK0734489.1 hypothetical protein B0T26DRAFT_746388 [Lasiosphaeria miniovina]